MQVIYIIHFVQMLDYRLNCNDKDEKDDSWVFGNGADNPPAFNFGCNRDVIGV